MFGKSSLSTRLLLSYVLLLAIAMIVIAVALTVLITSTPAPTQPVYDRFANLMFGLNLGVIEYGISSETLEVAFETTNLSQSMDDFAETRGVRMMWVNVQENQAQVVYDTAGEFTQGDDIRIRPSDENYTNLRLAQRLVGGFGQIYGSFDDEQDSEWLFGGLYANPIISLRDSEPISTNILIVAEPEAPRSLAESLNTLFGSELITPILQAGLIGLVVAIILAMLISRNLTRQLRRLAEASTAIAKGQYDQHVPVTGPSEIQEVAQSFNQMSAEVRNTQQAQRDFLANVSHDLKTPLTSIQGYSQALLDGAIDDPEKVALIILEESGRLNRMVSTLTDIERIQSGQTYMNMELLDVSDVVTATSQKLSVVAEQKSVTLDIDAPPTREILADGDRLAQVLTNLIGNAIKFTPDGGKITVTAKEQGQGIQVTIQDTGIGIPKEEQQRIYERFYQVDKSRGPQRGTGLGLAISREIVEAHMGTINISSDGLNHGTRVTIWLPFGQVE